MAQFPDDLEPLMVIEKSKVDQLMLHQHTNGREQHALQDKIFNLEMEIGDVSKALIQRKELEEELNKKIDGLIEQVTTLTVALAETKADNTNIVPNSSVKTPR